MRRTLLALALLGASGAVSAAMVPNNSVFTSGSQLDAYYSKLKLKVDGADDPDGDGGGLNMWLANNIGLLTAEIQKNSLDVDGGGNLDTRQYRIGMGYRFLHEPAMQSWLRAEYVRLDSDIGSTPDFSEEQEGYGVHLGTQIVSGMFRGYGEIGLLELEDMDGYEYKLGVAVQPNTFGGFVEYRASNLELDEGGANFKLQDMRIGVRVAY